ncbi:hypothetical protein E8A74_31205 [Polyangium fumosum]|uniref:Uncharacterized protein n=2 Tax=Polyangium fumosum TaxID=889272 RepID=A0A4U1J2G6_9BACT|nr:hypothetical protein E8A74_31205 [Polyangium fumosum]
MLVLAGPGAGEAHYDPAAGWATGSINLQFSAAGLAPRAEGVVAVLRRQSANAAENNELFWATWTKAGGFGAVQKVGSFGFAQDGPAASPLGVATLMTFLGTDNKHYFAQHEGGAFGPFGPMPAGMVQFQAFGPSATALASDGAAGVYAVYAGDDAHLYSLAKIGPGSAWTPSAQVPTSLVANWLRPFVLVDADQDVRMFYVRQGDNRICMVKLVTPQNTWSAEETVGTATTGLSPAVAATAAGDFVVAYRGVLNDGIYFVRGKDGAWGAATTIEVPQTPSSMPVVLPGLSGADAEIVYTTGGTLKHARVNGAQATLAAVPGVANVTHVAATMVP